MNKIIFIVLGICGFLYSVDLIYNAIVNDKPINPVTTLILIGVVIYIVYALFFDKKNKTENK